MKMVGKNGLLKCIASALIAAFAIGEAGAVSTSPINPAFLRWKKHGNKIHLPDTTNRSRTKLMSANSVEPIEERPLGQMPDLFDSSYLSTLNFNVNRGVADALPSSYDLRKEGLLTPVRDQGDFGTCWAHAACSALESWLLLTTGQAFDFSENNLANLHGFDWGFDDGGNGSLSQAYFLRWRGPVLESDDPYPNPGGSVELPPVRHVQRVRWIPGRTMYLDNDAIKAAVMKYGALDVDYYHIFDASCYNSSKAAYYLYVDNPQRAANHEVALVGWDDNYSKSNFSVTPPGNGAFIVRNNWGKDWGDSGYFYVSYYDESFAWNRLYAFTDAEPTDNYDGIYQYDPFGNVGAVGYGEITAWGAGLFTSTDGLPIAAVGFYALVPATSYTIRIYVGCSAGKPSSGTLAHEQTGKTDELGYWTVPLSKSVAVSKGQRFAVVLKLSTPGYNYPLAYEYAYAGYSSAATANAGETFLSSNGSSWSDFTDVKGTASFCCKAYTKKSAVIPKKLASLSISGATSLQAGKTAQFTCTAKYDNMMEKEVTKDPNTRWSILTGESYASVSSTGEVTAKSVTQQQTVKVHAEYTEDGITKGDDWSFYVTVAPPEPPTSLAASQGTDASCVRVTWTAPAGASSYSVYRGTTTSSVNAQFQQTVTVPKYNDNDAEPGVKYTYFIKAKNDSGTSGFSAGAQGWKALSAPEGVTASDGTSLEYVEVTWTAAPGAKYYRVYRSDDIDGEKSPLGTWQSETTYRDATATPGKVYCYYVVSAIDSRGNMASDYSIFDDGYVGVPVTLDYLTIDGSATIVSGGNATYTCTATYTDKSTRPVERPSWSIIAGGDYATVDSSGKVTASIVTANQTVTLQASYTDGVSRSTTKQITITATIPPAPSSVTLKSATTEAVTISWSSVEGAAGYSVWRGSSTADAKKIADVGTATEYADKSGTPGVSYKYWVKASNAAGESGFSAMSVTATLGLAVPTGVVASDGTYTDKTLISWKPVAGATYYRVARAGSASGSKTELGSWQTATSYEDKSGTAGTHYWYFVKAATSSSGANASAYSAYDEGWRPVVVTLSSIEISGATRLAAGGSTVLSCTAKYSSGSPKPVKPEWSVSPTTAATIDADGMLKAKSVTENVTVTVTARFTDGTTKTDTHEVLIVAPIVATAEVKNVQAKTRWPFSNFLDVDYELVTQPAGTRALVTLSGRDDDKGVAMAARTLTGDGATGPVEAGKHRLTWDVAADYPDFHAKAFSVEMSAVALSANMPSNVTASAGTSTEGVNVSWAAVDEATGYEVWRNTSSVTNGAECIQTTDQVACTDTGAVAGTTYYYWVRSVTPDGRSDFGKPVSGWRAYADITVTFNANGGSVSPTSKPYSPTKAYGSLPTASRTGYQFAGWYTASSGGSQVTTSSIVPTAATTLWAHWTANTYWISFNANGGSGSMSNLSMTYDVSKNLTANAFTKSGNTFKGWATSAGGSVAYTDGSSVKNLTTDNSVTVTLFAVWEAPVASLAEAVDNAALTITTGGGANWKVDTTVGYVGGASAKSGEIGDNQSSWMQTTITGPGTFSFRWKVSSEEAYDTLTWSLDGTQQDEISGSTGWVQVTKELTAGSHTIRWTYTKDESGGDGSDCGWVDAIVTPLLPPTNVSAGDGTVTASVKITWTAATGATSYTIWRAESNDSSSATQIGTATTTSYTDKTGTPGKPYYYWITATDGTRTSVFSTSDTGYRALAAPTSVTASDNTLAVGIRITWNAVEGADSYAIYRGTSTSSGSATQIGTSMGPAYVDSEVATGTTYYYYIKAVVSAFGTASDFSAYDKGSRKAGTPLYVVIDLSGGTTAGNYPISELSAAPSGGWTDEYKTNKLVLRWIANGSFMMGSQLGEGNSGSETLHHVTISKPLYMGVFEVTQKQYELVTGDNPSTQLGEARPVGKISSHQIRGDVAGNLSPMTDNVAESSFIGRIRIRTGMFFDLPTEAQWEYACRAGTTTMLNTGKDLVRTGTYNYADLDEVGRYQYDQSDGKGGYLSAHTKVGSYLPNAWGLYDMHGNVAEWCLDRWSYSLGSLAVTDPLVVSPSGNGRVLRGGGYFSDAGSCRSAYRGPGSETSPSEGYGFRLCCSAGGVVGQVAISFDANSGIGTMSSVLTGVGGSFAIPKCNFKRDGYNFAGWKTDAGDIVYADGDTIPCVFANMALYAKWVRVPTENYLVIDLSAGSNAVDYPISELTSIPDGGWTDEYKTRKLVLRRIPNGSFMMGSPIGELGREYEAPGQEPEDLHPVIISNPFYMGVFEVSQKQYELIMGENPSYFTNVTCSSMRPVDQVAYDTIRGSRAGALWPSTNSVDATSFLGRIRLKTGILIDLPTEAQWEYSCRAGTATALNNGKNLMIVNARDVNMDEVGRYRYNFPSGSTQYFSNADTSSGTAAIGSYKSNNWGLYDMHGNVKEWCLDGFISNLGETEVSDPRGTTSTTRVLRGGSFMDGCYEGRSASRYCISSRPPAREEFGFRLCCPAGALNQVTVSFDKNGGNGTMAPVMTGVGSSFVIPKARFTREGYVFLGWSERNGVGRIYADRDTIPNVSDNLILYANWHLKPRSPSGVAASDGSKSDGVLVTWNEVSGATQYCIYRAEFNDSNFANQIGMTTTTSYMDVTAECGITYYYWVKAFDADCESSFSLQDTGYRYCSTAFPSSTYIIVDLSAGANAAHYPVCELKAVPSEGWTDEYKTTKLVLRRIASGSFAMGSPLSERGRDDNDEYRQRQVTISKPFFIGVFQVTQKQYELVMGENPSSFKGDARPVECVSYDVLRGDCEGARWPETNSVDAISFIGKIQARTGYAFDLPTEAQWEYACRAGTDSALNSGKNLVGIFNDDNMAVVGRYAYNSGWRVAKDDVYAHEVVGSYLPNNWGLYDMHGNVWELCLDIYAPLWLSAGGSLWYPTPVADPKGEVTGSSRVCRGGGWRSDANFCRSARRGSTSPSYASSENGFRLCCPAE